MGYIHLITRNDNFRFRVIRIAFICALHGFRPTRPVMPKRVFNDAYVLSINAYVLCPEACGTGTLPRSIERSTLNCD